MIGRVCQSCQYLLRLSQAYVLTLTRSMNAVQESIAHACIELALAGPLAAFMIHFFCSLSSSSPSSSCEVGTCDAAISLTAVRRVGTLSEGSAYATSASSACRERNLADGGNVTISMLVGREIDCACGVRSELCDEYESPKWRVISDRERAYR